jgi:hypothetical protein
VEPNLAGLRRDDMIGDVRDIGRLKGLLLSSSAIPNDIRTSLTFVETVISWSESIGPRGGKETAFEAAGAESRDRIGTSSRG